MRTKIVNQIFKKEILDILRDKKTIFMMIILPIILYPILMVGMTQVMSMSMNSMEKENINIAFNKKPDAILNEVIKETNVNRKKDNSEIGEVKVKESKDYKKDLNDGKISAFIEISQNDKFKDFKVYINSSNNSSSMAEKEIENILNTYKEDLVENKVRESGLDVKSTLEPVSYKTVDVAKNEEVAGHLLGQILPFVLIIGLLMGAIYPAIDVMAGEKERGTLETLFTLPITNLELVMGKYMAVSLCAVVSAILNFLSIFITIAFLFASQGMASQMGMINIDLSQMILPGIITLICVCLFAMVVSAISMCVCSLAKSFKDAQNYITPITLLVMIPSYVSMIPNISLNSFTATIPVVNISLLIKSVLTFNSNISLIALVLVSNFVFVIISVLLLSKMFNSEEILFGSSKTFALLEKRSNIKKGTMPSIGDGVTLYAVGVVLLIYVGSLIQLKFKMGGIALTQIMIIGLPLLFVWYIKSDFKKAFSIKVPKVINVLGGIVLWIGTFIVVNLITQIMLFLFPQNMQVVEGLNDVLKLDSSFLLNLLVVAVMPAICEEFFFRGFVFTSFSNGKNKKAQIWAVICSGVLFGFMHIDFIRVIPTSILGIALGYAVYKSKSIFIPMLMHFLNNSVAVLAMHTTSHGGFIGKINDLLTIDFNNFNTIKFLGLIILSIILAFIGSKLLNNKEKQV
ncbi:ABC transporter permease [Paeniclostridium sordellii]|uniref:ABC transporter permease subunit/CPBP intramembrane protease n=1 Tax=Paraclostridium sordellii TaxID=1505 RepID=UPI00189B614B|nr:ABC transporter permease subunit/CPBP intramembrane protease [Paeniclostridium sordellii]MCQ4696625.1 ABC transporter permease [Paeniclostridium sordellii]